MLENLPPNTLQRLLRRTTISAILAGVVGFFVAILLGSAPGALGVVVGIGFAIGNLRFLDRQAAKVELSGVKSQKAIRRQLGSKTAVRLFFMTVVVLGAVWFDAPLGIGIVAGLVIYQIVFVFNVLRVMNSSKGVE